MYAREVTYDAKSLFPRYIFAKFSLTALYHKIRYTRGVHSLVAFGDYPTPVSEDLINLIQSREGQDGFVRIGEELRGGDKLFIKEGPFRDFIGILERKMKDSDRVMVLLETIRYQVRVIVEKEYVRKFTAEDLD
jgi:transcription antitermination factor NusG